MRIRLLLTLFLALMAFSTDAQILPVEWLEVSAKEMDGEVLVCWVVVEDKNDYFTIQRSTDGENWETIGTKEGAGTTHYRKAYGFWDTPKKGGIYLYRIKQTDFDGSFSYSKMVSVAFGEFETPVKFGPNPTNGVVHFHDKEQFEDSPYIVSMTGQRKKAKVSGTSIDLSEYPAGTYYIVYSEQGNVYRLPVVKE